MIDLTIDAPYHPDALCECGDEECLGSAEVAGAIAASLAASLPQLQSPMLRLIKERNEARELVKQLLYTAHLGDDSQEKYNALGDASKALNAWKGGAQ